jgi:hypothetical protein
MAAAVVTVALLSTDAVISLCLVGCEQPARSDAATVEAESCHGAMEIPDAGASLGAIPRCCHQTPELAAPGLPTVRTSTTADLQVTAAPLSLAPESGRLPVLFVFSSRLTLSPPDSSRSSALPLRL